MKRLVLAIIAFSAAPALAQQPAAPIVVGLTKASPSAQIETDEQLARRWEREQALSASRITEGDIFAIVPVADLTAGPSNERANADTPLPPPCEPPMPRSPPQQPAPPAPGPVPR